MENKILAIFAIALLGLVLLSGCAQTTNTNSACDSISSSPNAGNFSETDAANGMYYGSLDQKKPGTPAGWVHVAEGTRSAAWVAPKDGKPAAANDCKISPPNKSGNVSFTYPAAENMTLWDSYPWGAYEKEHYKPCHTTESGQTYCMGLRMPEEGVKEYYRETYGIEIREIKSDAIECPHCGYTILITVDAKDADQFRKDGWTEVKSETGILDFQLGNGETYQLNTDSTSSLEGLARACGEFGNLESIHFNGKTITVSFSAFKEGDAHYDPRQLDYSGMGSVTIDLENRSILCAVPA
ncbi:Uncharacterised protein [Candidatus Gugararchaeum adminiculabundum]|nr:Uncharacterised protein [Candidatus Gugararchaeum adminiculabundum]